MSGPCNGLTVLDFSLGMPGAICTLVMADYGAEVIKVDRARAPSPEPTSITWKTGGSPRRRHICSSCRAIRAPKTG
ncbi:MAG TPA: hypothetical protein EYO17_17890 [Dehalococcoidia bacterium]|nr:hypothetical protein [Dehalococcoidia bacterium]